MWSTVTSVMRFREGIEAVMQVQVSGKLHLQGRILLQ